MKYFSFIGILFFLFSISTFSQIPKQNVEIIEYVNTVINTKVDRGECWDLANQALTRTNAQWDGKYKYGKLVNPENDSIYQGDIIHFSNVKIKNKINNILYTEIMKNHTAIIYKVINNYEYKIAHQNTSEGGKKVIISNLNIKNCTNGKIKIYRPEVKFN